MDPVVREQKVAGAVIDGYYEPTSMASIINISNCSMGNKIKSENGAIIIVREMSEENQAPLTNPAIPSKTYARVVEPD